MALGLIASFAGAAVAPTRGERLAAGPSQVPERVMSPASPGTVDPPTASPGTVDPPIAAAASGDTSIPRSLRALRVAVPTLRSHDLVPVHVGEFPRTDPNDGTAVLTEPFQGAGGRQALGPALRRLGWIAGQAQFLGRRRGGTIIVQASVFREADGAEAAARALYGDDDAASVDSRAATAWHIDGPGRSQEVGWVRGRFFLLVEVSSVRLGAPAARDLRDRLFPVLDEAARSLVPAWTTNLRQAGVAPARLGPAAAAALGLVGDPGDAGRRGHGQAFRRPGPAPLHVRIQTWALYGRDDAEAAFAALQAEAGAPASAAVRGRRRYALGGTVLRHDWVHGPYILRVTVVGHGDGLARFAVEGAVLRDAVAAALDADLRRRLDPSGTV